MVLKGAKLARKLANKTKVSVVSAACLLGLVVILKNVIGVPSDVLARDAVLFVIVYSALSLLYPENRESSRLSRLDRPLVWSLLIIFATVGIVALYAI